jgi:hypothetical protein
MLRSLFNAKPTAARRPRSVKLGIEDLEERMVPAASSFNMHSVLEPATGRTVVVFHPQDNVNAPLVENTGPGQFQQIASAGAVTDFSVGLDPTGHAAVYAHFNGVMEEFTQSTGWTRLNEPAAMAHFAATRNGDLYAVDLHDNLWQFTPPVFHSTTIVSAGHIYHGGYFTGGWSELPGPNTFIAVDAVTQTSNGLDIVVGMNANRQLSWFVPASGYLDSFSGSVNTYSVGLDTSGYFDVFVVIGNSTGQLQEYDPSQGGWQAPISASYGISPLATISATSGGQCFVLSTFDNGTLSGTGPAEWEYSSNIPTSGGFVEIIPLTSSIMDISAAGADNLIAMDSDGGLEQYSGTGYGHDAFHSLEIPLRQI